MRHLAAAIAIVSAAAQEVPITSAATGSEAGGSGTQWTIGLGAGAVPQYQGSSDYRAIPLWNIRAQNLYHPDTYAQLFTNTFTSNLIPDSGLRLGPMLQYLPKRGSVDNNRVDDMQNVDPSLMLGAVLGYDFKLGERRGIVLEALGRQDVANGNGFLGTLQATYRMPLGAAWTSTIGVETTYASDDYMQAYFGVDSGDARRSGLDRYEADAGLKDAGANLTLGYAIDEHWGLSGLAAYRRLLNDAKDSPVTEEGDENQWYGGLLVNYRF
jgi:MipA family protein